MNYLIDTLIGWKYAKEVWKAVPKTFGIRAFLELDIGKGYDYLDSAADQGYAFLGAHAMFKDKHDFSTKDFKEIERRCKLFDKIAAAHSQKFYLSGACEHGLNARDASALIDVVRNAAPHCIPVNVPLSNGATVPDVINESHGAKAKPRTPYASFSSDGDAIVDIDVTTLKQTFAFASFFALWEPRMNGRWETNDPTPRPSRKGWIDAKLLKSVCCLAMDKGATKLRPRDLYKSHSENGGKGDERAEMPVFIIPEKVNSISVGNVKFPRYKDPYNDGRWRYYGPKMGFEIATSPVDVKVNGKVIGRVNPAFRDGQFR